MKDINAHQELNKPKVEQLKRCPFCGKEGYITLYDSGVAIFWHKYGTCDLGFSEFRMYGCDSTEEAIRRWNTRK